MYKQYNIYGGLHANVKLNKHDDDDVIGAVKAYHVEWRFFEQ